MFLFKKHGGRYSKIRPKSAVISLDKKKRRMPDKICGFVQCAGRNTGENVNCHADIMILFTEWPDIHQVRRM
jgi:hypothetical protein